MQEDKRNATPDSQGGRHEHRLPNEIDSNEKRIIKDAHDQAEKDMDEDAELTAHSPNDDLDEGETARLGKDGDKKPV